MKPMIFAILAGATLCGPALAQSSTADQPQSDVSGKGGTLSDKLSDTGGVIHPQDSVDQKMSKPAPSAGTMSVIPPPGSPGGNRDVQPK